MRKISEFLSENFHFFLVVKFSVYLNRLVFVMKFSVYLNRRVFVMASYRSRTCNISPRTISHVNSMLGKTSADDILNIFSYFSQKIGVDNHAETICMKN